MFKLRTNRKITAFAVVIFLLAAGIRATPRGRNRAWGVYTRMMGRTTVEQRLAELGPAARSRMSATFSGIGTAYPPARVALLIAKVERVMEVYVAANRQAP